MIDAPAHDAAARSQPPGENPADESSWSALGRSLFVDIAGVVRERLHLVALEGQQFVHAAGRLLALGVVAALLVLTAWFVVVAAVVALLVHLGLPLALALVLGAALNLLAAAWAWSAMRRQLRSMSFPATLRALQFAGAAPEAREAPHQPAPPRAVRTGAVGGPQVPGPDVARPAERAGTGSPP